MRPQSQPALARILSALLVFSLCMASCRQQQQQQASAPPPVPEVVAMTVQAQQILLTSELPGRTAAYRTAEIRPQVSGLIQKRLFKEGANVDEGEALYQIDASSFQSSLNNAVAALGRSAASLPAALSRAGRYKELLSEKAVSRQEYDDAAAALKQVEADIQYWKANVETARINLDYTRIVAPISGRIGRSGVTEGAIVTAYQPVALATIQQLDPIYVDVPQSTGELLRLRQRLKEGRVSRNGKSQNLVGLILEDGSTYSHEGSLQFRDVTVDPTTSSVVLRVVFSNPDGVLLPGMFVRAVMKEGVNERAMVIPQQAVSRDSRGNPTTLIVDGENKVQQRMLAVDRAIGDQWLVSSGLAEGDRVIVEGVQKVRPGAVVKVIPIEAASRTRDKNPEPQAQTVSKRH